METVLDLPTWLRPAVEAVLADMQAPTQLVLAVTYSARADPDSWGVVRFRDGGGDGFEFEVPEVPADGREVDLLIRLADELPFYLCELQQSYGQLRNLCPGHTHGAIPVEHATTAWWACPRDGSLLGPIGALDIAPDHRLSEQ
jgi:hypothetical protein